MTELTVTGEMREAWRDNVHANSDAYTDDTDIIEGFHAMLAASEEYQALVEDAMRYSYIRENHEWRRCGESGIDDDAHAYAAIRFPYYANISCAAMLDHNIDAMRSAESDPDGR